MANAFLRVVVLGLLAYTGLLVQPTFAQSTLNTVTVQHSGKCLDIASASTANGALLTQSDCTGALSQQFTFVQVDATYFQIVAKHSNKCLDINNLNQAGGANVQQWECNGGANQLLKYVDKGAGFGSLVFKHSNKCLDVYFMKMENGANLAQWDCNGGANQLFKAAPVSAARAGTPAVASSAPRSIVPNITIQAAPVPTPTATAQPPKSEQQLKFEADQAKQVKEAAEREAKAKAEGEARAKLEADQKAAKVRADAIAAKMAAEKQVNDENISVANIARALLDFQAYTDRSIGALEGWRSAPDLAAGLKQLDLVDTTQSLGNVNFEKTFQTASDVFAKRVVDSDANPTVSNQSVGLELLGRYNAKNVAYTVAKGNALTELSVKFTPTPAVSGNLGPLFAAPPNDKFCWRNSYGRGVGTIPTSCGPDEEKLGALCYKRCPVGMERPAGTLDCHSVCPRGSDGKTLPGWRDDGLFCRQVESGRGAGYPWKFGDALNNNGMLQRCNAAEAKNGKSCEMWGAIAYPKCPPGQSPFGCCLCRPDPTPDCSKLGLGGKLDLSCAKKIEIGKPNLNRCTGGKVMDAGLCYDQCKPGYKGVGPVCWGNPPQNWVNCGMGAANTGKACDAVIDSQFKAVGDIIMSFKGSRSGGQEPDVDQLRQQVKALKTAWKLTKIKEEAEKRAKKADWLVDKLARANGNGTDPTEHEIDTMPDTTPEDIARITLRISGAVIGKAGGPAGAVLGSVASAVGSYTYPLCSVYATGAGSAPPPPPKPPVLTEAEKEKEKERIRQAALAERDKCKWCQNAEDLCGDKLDMCMSECVAPRYTKADALSTSSAWPDSYILKGGLGACYSKMKISQKTCNIYSALYAPGTDCGPTPVVHQTRAAVVGKQPGYWTASCPANVDTTRTDCMRLAVEGGDNQMLVGNGVQTFRPLQARLRWHTGAAVPNFPVRFSCVPLRATNPRSGCYVLGPRSETTDNDGFVQTDTVQAEANSAGDPIPIAVEAGGSNRCDVTGKCPAYQNEAIRASSVTYFNLSVLSPAQKAQLDQVAETARMNAAILAAADSAVQKAYVGNPVPTPVVPVGTAVEPDDAAWVEVGGTANEIGAGGTDTWWIVGTKEEGGAYLVWHYDHGAKRWVPHHGLGARRIDVDSIGLPWIVDGQGQVQYYKSENSWANPVAISANRNQKAYDIGVGGNGANAAVWIVGDPSGTVSRLRKDNSGWETMPDTGLPLYDNKAGHWARRIDVDPNGNAWIIRYDNSVFRYTGSSWVQAPGIQANDIGIGADGTVFATGDGLSVNQWTGSSWFRLTKGGDRRFRSITVTRNGQPLGTDQNSPYSIRLGYKLIVQQPVNAAPVTTAPTTVQSDPWAAR